jgi:hypothetical protein
MLKGYDSAGPVAWLALAPRTVWPSLSVNKVGAPEG